MGIDIWGGDGCPFSHLQRGGTPTGHEEGVRVGGSLEQKGKCFSLSGELGKQFRCSYLRWAKGFSEGGEIETKRV